MSQWGKRPSYVQQRRSASRLDKERDKDGKYLVAISRIADALEGTKTQDQTDDDKRASREKLTIWLLVFTVIFTGLADVIFYATLRDSHENSMEQLGRLDKQLGLMADSSRQTDVQIAVNKDLAAAAKDQADAARQGAAVARDNIVAGSRAWVGPNGATIEGTPAIGNSVDFVITYQNSGRQPATGFVPAGDVFTLTTDDAGRSVSKISENVEKCRAQPPIAGAEVVYPSTGFSGNQYRTTVDKSLIDDEVVKGDKLIVMTGCFAYITFDTAHHSAYCFYFRNGTTKPPNLSFCVNGSYAD
jgi:hypothetical protein